jgi:hypothetical protein
MVTARQLGEEENDPLRPVDVARLHHEIAEAESCLVTAPPLPDARAEQLRQEAAQLSCDLLIALGKLRERLEALEPPSTSLPDWWDVPVGPPR